MDWMTGLRSTTPMPVDTSALSEDGLSIHGRFGVDGLGWSVEVSEEVVETIFASMPSLAAESTLRQVFTRGVRASLLREMRQAAGDDVDPLTAEGGDVARDFVRRGLDLTTLLESIRIGGAVSASAFITGANQLVEDPERRADEIQRLSRLFFGTLEQFSRQMSEVYGLEQARWRASQSAERLGAINAVLASREGTTRVSIDALQYDLDVMHVALITWAETPSFDDPARLAKAATDELRAHGATSTIVVPVGIGTAWAWGTVHDPRPAAPPVDPPPGILVATSQVHRGEAGFRRAHREAKDVEHLLRLAGPSPRRSLRHADVELAVLLASDLENAQHFVRRQLGRLAVDDERMAGIRTTLWLYLEHERSVATVAGLQFLARNTVTYRVKQAEQLIGRRIDDARLDIHAALLIVDVLGARVLVRP